MIEAQKYDIDKIDELLCAVERILEFIDSQSSYQTIQYKNGLRIINLRRLVRYERYAKKYIFIFEDHEEEYSALLGKRVTKDNSLPGFFAVNRNDVINISFVSAVRDNRVYLSGESEYIYISRAKRRELEKKLYL